MIIYNLFFNILIALFYVKYSVSNKKSVIVKLLLILFVLINSFYSIFIFFEINLTKGLFFYLSKNNLNNFLKLEDILFFSKFGLINLFIIVIFIVIFFKISKKKFFLKIKLNNYLIIFLLIILNPILITFVEKINNKQIIIKQGDNLKKEIININNIKNYKIKNNQNKNIIFLIIESLNKEIVEDSNLMPFLSDLSKKSTNFNNINELDLTNYTTTGMYALLCGNFIPEYGITKQKKCLTHLLSDNNYNIEILRGDSNTFFDRIEATTTKGKKIDYGQEDIIICDEECFKKKNDLSNFHTWGAHDHLVFKEIINRYKKNYLNNDKFAIIAKNIDSHIEGYLTKDCSKKSNFKTDIEKIFFCIDLQINKIYDEVKKVDKENNTILVIASDHLSMNEKFIKNLKKKSKKNFFLIHDFSDNMMQIDKQSTKLDIPATLLDKIGLSDVLGTGVSLFSSEKNLYQRINNLNDQLNFYEIKKEPKQFHFKSYVREKLKNILPVSTYLNLKKIYHKFNQNFALLKYNFFYKNYGNKKLNPNDFKLIAHGGGKIDNNHYTNSLEAINSSYKKGFKYIELDILKTSDGHFVAAHDWISWAKKTGYNKELPPTLSEFKKLKIDGKYSPLSIYDIKDWFKIRKELTLITDKINQPKEFIKYFDLQDQLIMELFDLNSIIEANENKINFFASDIFLYKNLPLNRKLLETLASLPVHSIAASNIVINKHINFFIEAKEDMGMGIFFYQLSEKIENIETDQIKFLCSYGSLLAGGYLEDIDFEKEINCK